jgi:anti-sigma regulatory factor (Ser/Thr protein kinase)
VERLLVDADPARLPEVTAFAAGDLRQGRPQAADRVTLAVEELFVNICAHAYGGGKGLVAVTRDLATDGKGGEWLVIKFTDRGRPFDPLADAPAPDLGACLPERKVGGLGIHLARHAADGFSCRRTGEGNETEMRFLLREGA